eukprot:12893155-Prorocentrum_lima.AAC.1
MASLHPSSRPPGISAVLVPQVHGRCRPLVCCPHVGPNCAWAKAMRISGATPDTRVPLVVTVTLVGSPAQARTGRGV